MALAGSSPALLAAMITKDLGLPVAIITPEDDEARRAALQAGFFVNALSGSAGASFLPCRPVLRTLPMSGDGDRTAALSAMVSAGKGSPAIVSGGMEAWTQRTMPPEALLDNMTEISPGLVIERDDLTAMLVRSGYTAVSQVMEPGDFSVRGGIVDVFPPGALVPARIELWEEEVKSIRDFEPDSQKSTTNIDSITVPPLKEVIVTEETAERAAEWVREEGRKLKERGESGIIFDPSAYGEVMERIESRDHFPGIESFLPAYFEEEACALDYGDRDWVAIHMEPFLCEQALERAKQKLADAWEHELAAGSFAIHPESHLCSDDRVVNALSGMARVKAGVEGGAAEEEKALPGVSGDLSGLKADPDADEPLAPLLFSLRDFSEMGVKTVIVSPMPGKAERFREMLSAKNVDLPFVEDPGGVLLSDAPALITVGPIQKGVFDPTGKIAVVPESEIFGEKIRQRRIRRPSESFIGDLSDLSEGDYVVHVEHGVGVYRGLTSLSVQWVGEWDFVNLRERPRIRMDSAKLEYEGGSSLYVPVHRINQISKYRGPTEAAPSLDTLGGTSWERLKRRVKKSIREFAEYLIRIYAERKVHPGSAFPSPDSNFREFEENFEYEETPDQLHAIEDVLEDMQSEQPMDRVVCGDVGYGKTEVALRAAFLSAMSGRQVAVLVPTTILAQQHYETFSKRLARYPVEVSSLSRFLTAGQQKEVIAGVEKGKVDIVIGTHRLLSKDMKFADLGLLVIDEEHRFGVKHKEKLRELRSTVDTLTLTATPIPRTLHMALSGLRDLSIIDTPPPDRLSVHTELVRSDDRVIREAIERELRRGGQVFFVHNRVKTIEAAAGRVRKLVPNAKVAVAHGQMKEKELEKVMLDFVRREHDVLVTSAIIESGLDIPTANTMIVDRADHFGLAQLYQLRGRIGRSKVRGYCYLMVPAKGVITDDAAKRLKVLKEFTELGSGFRVAAHDLEIRGAGNMLGPEQSGHIGRIGLELYMNLLDEEIEKLKGEPPPPEFEPEIKLPAPAYLADEYVPDPNQRLSWYKRLSKAKSGNELDDLREEMRDRYGALPEDAENLFEIARVKAWLRKARATELGYTGTELTLALADDTVLDIEKIIKMATKEPRKYRLTPDNRLFMKLSAKDPSELFPAIRELLNEVSPGDIVIS